MVLISSTFIAAIQIPSYIRFMILEAKDIYKKYGDVEVLRGISLSVNEGEVISLAGPSGAGKSTLLHIIGTLDKPDKGNVHIRNTDIFSMSEKALSRFRNQFIGFIFQFHHLLPEFTALENVCIPAFIHGTPQKEAEHKAMELLAMLRLENRKHHKPSQLSGGEQQRVAVARSLINSPALVLADEPSGNLDTQHARELHRLFFDLRDKLKQTFIIVTHNDELAQMADRMYYMNDGLIVR